MLNHRKSKASDTGSGDGDREPGERIRLLEEALADYVARYGLTDLAREALKPERDD